MPKQKNENCLQWPFQHILKSFTLANLVNRKEGHYRKLSNYGKWISIIFLFAHVGAVFTISTSISMSEDGLLKLCWWCSVVFSPNLETTKDSMSWASCQCQTLFSIIRITLTMCFCEKPVIVDMLHILTQKMKEGAQQLAEKALWSVWALEPWSSRANQWKTKAHNSRGLYSCWSAFNANRAYFHTPLIAWIDCLLNS